MRGGRPLLWRRLGLGEGIGGIVQKGEGDLEKMPNVMELVDIFWAMWYIVCITSYDEQRMKKKFGIFCMD